MMILLFLTPLITFGKEYKTYVKAGRYKVYTESNLEIQSFELGLRCKIYSKLRFIGAPITTKVVQTEKKNFLKLVRNEANYSYLLLGHPSTLVFSMNELTSYVHACTFIADIKVIKNGDFFERNNLALSDYTIDSSNYDGTFDLTTALNFRNLKINKYTNDIVFY